MNPNDELIELSERLSDAVQAKDVDLIKGCFKDFEDIEIDECDMDVLEEYNEMAQWGFDIITPFDPTK